MGRTLLNLFHSQRELIHRYIPPRYTNGIGIIGLSTLAFIGANSIYSSLNGTKINGALVLVTGASSGIGEATARAMAAKGARVILVARTKAKLDQIVSEIESSGGIAYSLTCDLTNPDDTNQLVTQIKQLYGLPDIIIHSAGAGRWLFAKETSNKELVDMMATPFFSSAFVTKLFLDDFIKRNKGHILFINTPAAIATWPGAIGYVSTRRALHGYYETLSMELYNSNVKVSECIFGATSSDYWSNNPGTQERIPGIARIFPTISCQYAAKKIINTLETNKKFIVAPVTWRLVLLVYVGPLKKILDWITVKQVLG